MSLPRNYLLITALWLISLFIGSFTYSQSDDVGSGDSPNVILFSMDDLNDWVSPLGYSQAITPNMDRLADAGVLFTNAHADRESYAVINSNWRYIRYNDGTEELYNVKEDPHEWNNLMGTKKYDSVIQSMKQSAPEVFAPSATSKNELRLGVDGDSFHWEPKNK